MSEAGERAADAPATDEPTTVGARLRAAREARGQTLDEIGKQTRVPVRHLVQIEEGRLDGLPAAPYSAGFVKAYARAVDLDPVATSQEFRAEFARATQASPRIAYEPYEPADPNRLPPRMLAIVAIVIAVLLAAGYGIWRSGILTGEGPGERAELAANGGGDTTNTATPVAPGAKPAAQAPAIPVGGAVRLTAAADTWLEVTDKASGTRLYTGVLKQGQSWDVPANAAEPVIRTGRPEGLQVTVGGQPVAPLGEPAHTISNVSLKAASLVARGKPSVASAAPASGPPHAAAAAPPADAAATEGAPPPAANDATPSAFRDATPTPSNTQL